MSIGIRIKKRRKELGLSAEKLAELVGCSPATIYRYESGQIKNTRTDKLEPIAEALQIDPSELMGWMDRPNDPPIVFKDILPVTKRSIPLLGEIAAGEPIYTDQEFDAFVVPGEDIECDFALKVVGDSMEPRFIQGDIVFFRAQDDVDDGQIAAVIVDDQATLKRVYHLPDGAQLISDNPKYPPMIFNSENSNSVRILGLAVGYFRRLH